MGIVVSFLPCITLHDDALKLRDVAALRNM